MGLIERLRNTMPPHYGRKEMKSDLAERLGVIHAEAIEYIRGLLVTTTDHDLELLTTGNWGRMTKYVAEQILAERAALGQSK